MGFLTLYPLSRRPIGQHCQRSTFNPSCHVSYTRLPPLVYESHGERRPSPHNVHLRSDLKVETDPIGKTTPALRLTLPSPRLITKKRTVTRFLVNPYQTSRRLDGAIGPRFYQILNLYQTKSIFPAPAELGRLPVLWPHDGRGERGRFPTEEGSDFSLPPASSESTATRRRIPTLREPSSGP